MHLLGQLNVLVPAWFGLVSPLPLGVITAWGTPLTTLLGGRYCLAELVTFSWLSVYDSVLYFLLLLLLLRAVLRKPRLTAGAFVVLYTTVFTAAAGAPYTTWLFMLVIVGIGLFVMLRFGLLATVALLLVRHLLVYPITANVSAWYAGSGFFALFVIALLAGYGCYTSLAGQSLFGERLFLRSIPKEPAHGISGGAAAYSVRGSSERGTGYREERIVMPYTMDDFRREFMRDFLKDLVPWSGPQSWSSWRRKNDSNCFPRRRSSRTSRPSRLTA